MNRDTAEWILIGLMLANKDLRDWGDIREAFMGKEQEAAALSICNGKVPDALYQLRPTETGEKLVDSMVRGLKESAVRGRVLRTFKRLSRGELLRVEPEELDQAMEFIQREVGT